MKTAKALWFRFVWWCLGYREHGRCVNCHGIGFDDGAPCETCR